MMMVEALNSPACGISISRNNPQSHIYCCSRRYDFGIHLQCISCAAYYNLGLRIKLNCVKNHVLGGVVSKKSRVMPNKVATSLEFESVCEERRITILDNEGFDEDLEDESARSDNRSRNSVKTTDETYGDLYFLEERNEEVLSKRIIHLSRSNKIRSALSLYRSMECSNLLPSSHACNSLLSSLLRNRKLDDALKIFEFMKSSEIITGHTYSLILKAVANSWSLDAALNIFDEAEKCAKTSKYMDAIVYNTMISIFGKVDDWVKVEMMWRGLQENGHIGTDVTYRLLVCTFVRCDQNELALDAYHEMIRNGLSPDEDAMQAIIGACTREGKWEMALNVLQSMLNGEVKPSLVSCNALINSLAKVGKVELAFNVYSLIKSLGYKPDAYTWNGLIGALNRANQHADAIRLFDSIKRENGYVLNVHIYNTCLMSCKRLGLWDRATQILWEMEASEIDVPVTSYNLVIGACEVAKKPKVALQVYQHMIRKKQSPDVFTLLSLIRVCIWGSLWSEVEEILNYEPNGSLYNAAIQGMCLRSNTDSARKLYGKMREMGLKPDGKTRALMLQNLPRS